MSDALLEAVRGLRVAEPDLGVKPLLAKLREQHPELEVASKEVREALRALDMGQIDYRVPCTTFLYDLSVRPQYGFSACPPTSHSIPQIIK